MSKIIFHKLISAICLGFILAIGSGSFTKQVLADNSSESEREGLPGRRVGGGTRSGSLLSGKPVTALVPENTQSLTIAETPTLFFYVPKTESSQTVEFELSDESGKVIYQTKFTTNGNPGVIGVKVSANGQEKPLEFGKNYRWFFAVVSDPNEPSSTVFVNGLIKRIQPSQDLVAKLKNKSQLEQIDLYLANNLWGDALYNLAELRKSNPNDRSIESKWREVLQSLQLDNMIREPLVEYQVLAKQTDLEDVEIQ